MQTLNKKILIFGSNSTLAKELILLLNKKKFRLQKLNSNQINFLSTTVKKRIDYYLNKKPDIIINFVGKFELNKNSNEKVLFLNVMPTWLIIKYYLKKNIKRRVRIICVGSNSQNSPRKNYMLYAASKTALNNLVDSCNDYFKNTKLSVKIFNPKTFGGKHLNAFKKKIDVTPSQVAKRIFRYITKM